MSELEEIRIFVQLVEFQSATQVAERMGVANSAVSRRLKELESRLGVQLIRRTTRRMSLTESGEIYYQRCKSILESLEEAQAEITQSTSDLKGRLRIATPVTFGVNHLASAIAAFMSKYPEMEIDLDMSDRRVDLVEEGFDLAIRIGTLEDSTLIAKKLAPVSHVVCASPDFFQQHGIPQTPDDLMGVQGLCYGNLKKPDTWHYQGKDGNTGEVKVALRMKSNNGDALREAAIAGLGVICEPNFIMHDAIKRGLLTAVLSDYKWYNMDIYAIYPQTKHLSIKVRTFIDFLIGRFGTKPYWEDF